MAMAQRGSGKIINVTTAFARVGMPAASAYGASKAAVDLLTKAWAADRLGRLALWPLCR
jgi:NAD(P)-dependent dehydrogenase (short-subunit alcohol dehydrogenase family)